MLGLQSIHYHSHYLSRGLRFVSFGERISFAYSLDLLSLLALLARRRRGLLLLAGSASSLLIALLRLRGIPLLGVPLASLQDKDTNQDEGKNGVAGSHNAQAVLPSQDVLALNLCSARLPELLGVPQVGADGAEALDNVGRVDSKGNDVEEKRSAVKQKVGLAWAEELDQHAGKSDKDHDVEHAADEGRRRVQEAQVCLEGLEKGFVRGHFAPKQRKVVGEAGKEHTEEEAGG